MPKIAGHVAMHERIDNGLYGLHAGDPIILHDSAIILHDSAGIVPRNRQGGTAQLCDANKTRPGVVRIGVKRILGHARGSKAPAFGQWRKRRHGAPKSPRVVVATRL
jgi:hypothetical protein